MIVPNTSRPISSFLALRQLKNKLCSAMGQTQTVIKEVESDESKRIRLLGQLDNQLKELKAEVTSVQPSIKENVRETIFLEQNAVMIRYSELKNKQKIVEHVKEMFGNFPLLEFLVDTATTLVRVMASSEEMKELLRWHDKKLVKRVGNKVYGIEAHYKVKVLEEIKGNRITGMSKDTVVMIAYKCLSHAMDLDPEDFPDDKALAQIKF